MHKFGYTEKSLITKLFDGTKEKQKSHEKKAHAKLEKSEKNFIGISKFLVTVELADEVNRSQREQLKKITVKTTYLEKWLNDRMQEEKNAKYSYMSFFEEYIRKRLLHFLFDKGIHIRKDKHCFQKYWWCFKDNWFSN